MEPLWRYMAFEWETIAQWFLSLTALAMVWAILRLRQKRMMTSISSEDTYSGDAKNPEELMHPDEQAITELDHLLESKQIDWD